MKTTTYQQALANGEISLEIPVYESQHLFVSQKGIIKLSDSNHLTEGLHNRVMDLFRRYLLVG
uniref:hypothetical protein n=1 Tax=Helicobacter typhlonius TaxID=76936 RepID=UPI002FE14C9C